MVELTNQTVRPARPDLTPLLDVVFILLIFFVVSAVFSARGMELELPEAESSKPVAGRSLEIDIAADGSLTCNAKPMDMDRLANKLRVLAQAPIAEQPGRILLKASPEARVEPFVRVLDMVRINGFENLVIATKSSAAGEKGK